MSTDFSGTSYTKIHCPFCGHHSTQVLGPHTEPNTSTHGKGYQIECTNCGARGPCGMAMPLEAGKAWDLGDDGHYRTDNPTKPKD